MSADAWLRLMNKTRLGKTDMPTTQRHDRNAFQKDIDRITFSSAFRRLQDKTQVFPLAKNDYVRTRLTHSLEVACVGQSIATQIGAVLVDRHQLQASGLEANDFASVVRATCLAHDLGNPPFGHFGEEAFRDFFKENTVGKQIIAQLTEAEAKDLLLYEGNAQGFRILTKLQHPEIEGGMQLTLATLGAFVKYPCSALGQDKAHVCTKKVGVFKDDIASFEAVAAALGLPKKDDHAYKRHPLVYLMEAADDICYGIIDIEDAYQAKIISFSDAEGLLKPLTSHLNHAQYKAIESRSEKLSYLRAKAIGCLVEEVVDCFLEHEDAIVSGHYHSCLADDVALVEPLRALTDYAAKHIYICEPVVKVELAGYHVLTELLSLFSTAVYDKCQHGDGCSPKSNMVLNLIPKRFLHEQADLYTQVLGICDFISGMTDSYAVTFYQRLSGSHPDIIL